jgi:glycosyltransferase involved in cell wall biosynthesis
MSGNNGPTTEYSQVIVVIPAYNEADTIAEVVEGLIGIADKVVVVDDGSTDETATLAREKGAIVLAHEENQGYDATLSDGVAYAADNGGDIIVTFDADGQHRPEDVPRIIEPIQNRVANIVVGRRPQPARPAEQLFAFYAKLRLGIDDPLSGLKAYEADVYRRVGYFDQYSSIGTHLMVAAAKRNYNIVQVDIQICEREDEPRFGHLRANWNMLKALGRIIVFDCKSAVAGRV